MGDPEKIPTVISTGGGIGEDLIVAQVVRQNMKASMQLPMNAMEWAGMVLRSCKLNVGTSAGQTQRILRCLARCTAKYDASLGVNAYDLQPAGRPPALPAGGTPHSGQAPCGLGNSPVPAAAASEAGRAARLRATPAGAPCASSELRARPRQSESIPGPALLGRPAAASDSSGSLRSGRPPVVRMLCRPSWRPCSLRQPLSRAGSRLARRPGSST